MGRPKSKLGRIPRDVSGVSIDDLRDCFKMDTPTLVGEAIKGSGMITEFNIRKNLGVFKKSKRGSIQDIAWIIAVFAVFSMLLLVSYVVYSHFDTAVQTSTQFPTEAKTASSQVKSVFTNIVDKGAIFLLIGMIIATFILASLTLIHPVFFVAYLIGMVFVINAAAAVSNTYTAMEASSQISAYAAQLPVISFIMGKLPWIIGVLGFGLAIVMYKVRSWVS